MAIHCHSARYHYDSFHNRGGDIINIGSNNTYNFGGCGFGASIWGNGGNFWGGFGTSLGWGLGNGLMNWLGNGLNGGGWNPAGIFGGYNMGYGMNPWQQMSTFSWGGSTGGGRSTSATGSSSSHTDCVDSDRQLINQLGSKVINLQKNPNASKEDAVKLYKEIAKAKENTNDIHKDTDQNDYDNWMNVLQNHATSKGWGDLSATDTATPAQSTTPTTTPSSTTPTTPATPTSPANPTATTPTTTGAENTGSTGDTRNSGAVQTAQTDEGNMPWSNINNWGNVNPLENTSITLPKGKGYSAITSNDTISSVKLAHDSSDKQKNKDVTAETSNLSTVKKTEQGKVSVPEYISLTTKLNNTYNYKCIGYTSNGLPVYTTPKQGDKNEGHIYILVKQGNDFVLLQCSKEFTGWGISDQQVN